MYRCGVRMDAFEHDRYIRRVVIMVSPVYHNASNARNLWHW
jgi:hypothetical protein